jgi:tetratricopeptide (TPR) repeat protein
MTRVKRRNCSSLAALLACSCFVLRADDPLTTARRAFEAGDYAGVVRLFEADPQDNQALRGNCDGMLLAGLALYRLNRLEQALIDLQAASACNPGNTVARTALGEAWLRKGNDQRALALFEGVLKEAPQDADALSGAATLYLKHDLNQQAAEALEKLVRLQPGVAKLDADLGAARAGLNDFVKAREAFNAALRMDPQNVSALMGLGHVELRTGHPDEAVRLLSRAATLDPKAFEPHFLLAAAWTEQKRYEEVIRECKEALRLGGKDPEIYYRLARAYRGMGNEGEGRKAMAEFTALRSTANENEEKQREAMRLVEQAKAMVDANRLQDAIDLLERSRSLGGSDPQLLFRLAGLYYDTQRFPQAREDVEAAIAVAPGEWTYQYLAGLIDEKTGRPEEAAKRLAIAARLHPNDAELFNEMGKAAMARRKYEEAARDFDAAARLDQHEPAYATNARAARQLAGK